MTIKKSILEFNKGELETMIAKMDALIADGKKNLIGENPDRIYEIYTKRLAEVTGLFSFVKAYI